MVKKILVFGGKLGGLGVLARLQKNPKKPSTLASETKKEERSAITTVLLIK